MSRPSARRTEENRLRALGFSRIAGVDEVGRGCLAGPVVAAAVVLPPRDCLWGIRDSKLLTQLARERFYIDIASCAVAWAVGIRSPQEVDRCNVHRASLEAMGDAICSLSHPPDFVLVDGFSIPSVRIPQRAVVGGDRRCAAIAAASIMAKVFRDRYMVQLHEADSRYRFDRHKGYATKAHLAAVARHGYSSAHRRSFRPAAVAHLADVPERPRVGCAREVLDNKYDGDTKAGCRTVVDGDQG